MPFFKNAICLIALCLPLSSCGNKEETLNKDDRRAVLCHIPFGVATSTGMEVWNFPRSCARIGELSVHDRKYKEILKSINKASPGPFLELGVRVTIAVQGEDIIYIDDDGGVIKGATRVKMDRYAFARVKRIVSTMARKSRPSLE